MATRAARYLDEFKEYVSRSKEPELQEMLEVAAMQIQHPDHMNRCWSGSPHAVNFLEVHKILQEEKKRRNLK